MKDSRLQVLKAVRDLDQASVTNISEEASYSRSVVSDSLKDLSEKSLIETKETKNPTEPDIREPTKDGLERIIEMNEEDFDLRKPNTIAEHDDPFFTHFFSLICRWDDPDFLSEDWRERLLELEDREDIEVSEQRDFGRVQIKSDDWVFKFTGRSLEIQLRTEISGEDFRNIAWKAWTRSLKGLDFLEEYIDESIPRERFDIRLKSAHVGSRGKDIAKTFVDHIESNTDFSPRDFEVRDEEDLIRIYADKSGPGGMWERESGNGGQKNGRKDTAFDDSELLQEFTWRLIDSPSDALRLIDQPSRLDDVSSLAQSNGDRLDEQEASVRSVRKALNTIRDNREAERDTRDALMELVRSNKQEREEMQRRHEERMDHLQESFQTQLEKQQEIIEGLQEEVENLREENKSLEARVRERYESDPGFSSVFEHSMNDSLYVWKYDGCGSASCEKVLDEKFREEAYA